MVIVFYISLVILNDYLFALNFNTMDYLVINFRKAYIVIVPDIQEALALNIDNSQLLEQALVLFFLLFLGLNNRSNLFLIYLLAPFNFGFFLRLHNLFQLLGQLE